MNEHDDPCFHCLYTRDSESCLLTTAQYCRELQTYEKGKKMTTTYDPTYDPCEGCSHETGACLITQGECYAKKVAAQKEAEEKQETEKEINFEAVETD